MYDFYMFNYLKIKGFSDKEKKDLQFDIKIEVVNS